jgi:hypothetical protein
MPACRWSQDVERERCAVVVQTLHGERKLLRPNFGRLTLLRQTAAGDQAADTCRPATLQERIQVAGRGAHQLPVLQGGFKYVPPHPSTELMGWTPPEGADVRYQRQSTTPKEPTSPVRQ